MNEAMKYALKLLKRQDYFIKDLYDRLVEKGFNQKDVCSVIKDLVNMDFINDEKLIYLKISNLAISKKYGRKYIINYFSKKNVSMNLVLYCLDLFGTDVFKLNKEYIIKELLSEGKEEKYIDYYLQKKGYEIE